MVGSVLVITHQRVASSLWDVPRWSTYIGQRFGGGVDLPERYEAFRGLRITDSTRHLDRGQKKKISSTITCISVRQLSEIILRRVEGIYDEGGKSGFASRCYFFLNCFFLIILSNTVGNPLADWLRGNLSHYSSDTKECNRCFLAVSHLLQELRVYVCSEIRLTRTVTPIVYS